MTTMHRKSDWSWIVLLVIGCVAGVGVARAGEDDVEGPWTLGHGDLSVEYDAADKKLEFELHLHEGAVVDGETLDDDAHGDPSEITIVVPASANLQRINNPTGFFDGASEGYDFTGSKFNVTGAAVGGNLWMLGGSADSAFYGTPFVGLSAEHLDSGDWDGQISFVLASVNFDGSAYGTTGGILSFFSEELDAVWSSQDGFLQQSISLTPGAGHEHGFFFFSQPGIYDMTLTASGTHDIEGLVTGTGTFRFEVVPEPSSVMLAGLGLCVTVGLGLRRRLAAARRG